MCNKALKCVKKRLRYENRLKSLKLRVGELKISLSAGEPRWVYGFDGATFESTERKSAVLCLFLGHRDRLTFALPPLHSLRVVSMDTS